MNKLLSVIVPVYNVERYLARCVDSILSQNYEPMEVILVDDGGTDGSGRICDLYARQDSRVRVIHKENGGLSSARNVGLECSSGEYLTFVDSDDYLEPDAYQPMIALLENLDGDLVCAGRYDVRGDTGEKTVGLCPKDQEVIAGWELAGRIFQWDGCDSSACDKIFKRTLFEQLCFPLGKTSEDMPVIYRAVLKADRAVMVNRPIYNYYHRAGSITQAAISEGYFDQEQHTAMIYRDICANAPQIAPQARYLRVTCLSNIMLRILLAEPADRKRFHCQYQQARGELSRHTVFFLTYPRFDKKVRIRNLLLVLGLYRAIRPLFTKDPTERT